MWDILRLPWHHLLLGCALLLPWNPRLLWLSLECDQLSLGIVGPVGTNAMPKAIKNYKKVVELLGLGVFVVYTLSFLHVIGLKNCLLTPPSWDLTNILNDDSFLSPNFASSATRSIKKFSEPPPPWGGSAIWEVWPGILFNYCVACWHWTCGHIHIMLPSTQNEDNMIPVRLKLLV